MRFGIVDPHMKGKTAEWVVRQCR